MLPSVRRMLKPWTPRSAKRRTVAELEDYKAATRSLLAFGCAEAGRSHRQHTQVSILQYRTANNFGKYSFWHQTHKKKTNEKRNSLAAACPLQQKGRQKGRQTDRQTGRSHLATSACPPPHAHIKGLDPNALSLSLSPAPACTKIFTTSSLPPPHAIMSGVQSSAVRAATLAGGESPLTRSAVITTSPDAQAIIKGVRPGWPPRARQRKQKKKRRRVSRWSTKGRHFLFCQLYHCCIAGF